MTTIGEDLHARILQQLPQLSGVQAQGLARAIGRLVAALEPERVYVFGSQARREARPDSDIDLLVIVPHSAEPGYRRDQAAYAAIGWQDVPIELLVLTRYEFDEQLPALASLAATVAREGRLLYAA